MKNIFFITAACIAATSPGIGATKCVNLNQNTKCDVSNYYDNQVDWSANCNGINIQGIAGCSSEQGGAIGVTINTLPTENTYSDGGKAGNTYCWCKMISPAISKWIYAAANASTTEACLISCARTCALFTYRPGTEAFRAAIFSNLSD